MVLEQINSRNPVENYLVLHIKLHPEQHEQPLKYCRMMNPCLVEIIGK